MDFSVFDPAFLELVVVFLTALTVPSSSDEDILNNNTNIYKVIELSTTDEERGTSSGMSGSLLIPRL